MNDSQKTAVGWCAILFIGSVLFPPWLSIGVETRESKAGFVAAVPVETATDYSFIGSPPNNHCRLDLTRLVAQWAAVLAVLAACLVSPQPPRASLRGQPDRPRKPSRRSLSSDVAGHLISGRTAPPGAW